MAMWRRVAHVSAPAMLAAAVLGLTAASSAAGPAGKTPRLVVFQSCGELLGYARSHAAQFVGPWGLGLAGKATPPAVPGRVAAPQQGVDYSGTNVQEAGVDEPDLVKTNGTTLFAVANGKLNAVDVSKRQPRLLDTLKLDAGWSHELLLYGNRLLVLSRGGYWIEPLPAIAARFPPFVPAQSVLSEVDVSDPKALRVVRTLTLDGAYVAARLVGRSARIVAASQVPSELPFEQPKDSTPAALAAASEHNRAVVASSGVASWLPSYRIARPGGAPGQDRPLVQCRHVTRPPVFSGLGLLSVLTIDLSKGLQPVDAVAVMTDARIVYASPENLYVATERWADRPDPAAPTRQRSGVTTAIHRFDISSPVRTQYRGSGSVSGYLLSQWSLSEYRGVLRVVSTETPAWWGPGGESESFLTTLRLRDGGLVQAGRLGELGKGERVYAVRFGQDANEQGRPLGTQLSIFDVSDLRHPTRLHRATLGQGWSEAESDHHAFLYWPRTGLVVIPFNQQAFGFRVGRKRGIDEVGRIQHGAGAVPWSAGIRRSLVVRDSVLTVSDAGVESSSLDTLAAQGWAAFPAPDLPTIPPGKVGG